MRLIAFFLACCCVALLGQAMRDVAGHEKTKPISEERQRLEAQIANTSKILSETAGRRQRTFNELSVLNYNLTLQQRMIAALDKEIKETQRNIDEIAGIQCAMEEDMLRVREGYGRTAQMAYQASTQENFWLAVLSASNLSEAFYRTVYFQQFNRYRATQLELLDESRTYLASKAEEWAIRIRQKEALIASGAQQRVQLQAMQVQKQRVYAEVKGKEDAYRKTLQQQQQSLKGFMAKLDEATNAVPATKASILLSGNFASSKGHLLWPVPAGQGVIVATFGESYDKVGLVKNDGITLRVPHGQAVSAVFEGEVIGVSALRGRGYAVFLQHGAYRSTYSGVDAPTVKKGDQVTGGQKIGIAYIDPRTGESLVDLVLYKLGASKSKPQFLNPEAWLAH